MSSREAVLLLACSLFIKLALVGFEDGLKVAASVNHCWGQIYQLYQVVWHAHTSVC